MLTYYGIKQRAKRMTYGVNGRSTIEDRTMIGQSFSQHTAHLYSFAPSGSISSAVHLIKWGFLPISKCTSIITDFRHWHDSKSISESARKFIWSLMLGKYSIDPDLYNFLIRILLAKEVSSLAFVSWFAVCQHRTRSPAWPQQTWQRDFLHWTLRIFVWRSLWLPSHQSSMIWHMAMSLYSTNLKVGIDMHSLRPPATEFPIQILTMTLAYSFSIALFKRETLLNRISLPDMPETTHLLTQFLEDVKITNFNIGNAFRDSRYSIHWTVNSRCNIFACVWNSHYFQSRNHSYLAVRNVI